MNHAAQQQNQGSLPQTLQSRVAASPVLQPISRLAGGRLCSRSKPSLSSERGPQQLSFHSGKQSCQVELRGTLCMHWPA